MPTTAMPATTVPAKEMRFIVITPQRRILHGLAPVNHSGIRQLSFLSRCGNFATVFRKSGCRRGYFRKGSTLACSRATFPVGDFHLLFFASFLAHSARG